MSDGACEERQAGYTLVALLASVTIMLILMGAATPTWTYIMQDDREEELLFRGGQIADAVARYQKKTANALPVSLEILVKGRFTAVREIPYCFVDRKAGKSKMGPGVGIAFLAQIADLFFWKLRKNVARSGASQTRSD